MQKIFLLPLRWIHSLVSITVIAGVACVFAPLFIFMAIFVSKESIYWMQKLWAFCFAGICGVRLTVSGQENIPDSGVVYLFNHKSFLDIPVLMLASRQFVNYVAKKELGSIPVVGWCIRAAGTLMMPRKDLVASIALYEVAKARLAQGEHFFVAPEGTRIRSEGIGEFKSGPFHFAMSCQADLVPVIITGTQPLWPAEDLLPNLRRMTNRVHLHFCPKISTKDWTDENRKQKISEVRQIFVKEYAQQSFVVN